MAVRELRPPLPPLAHDLGLVPERARLPFGETVRFDRTHGHEDVNVNVQPVALFVRCMNRPVRDKALAGEVFSDEIAHKKNLLLGRQLVGQGNIEAMGKLGIVRAAAVSLDVIESVPKLGTVMNPQGGVFGGADFRMKHAFFSGVIVNPFRPFIPQGIACAIGCGSNNALDVSSSFDGVMKMKNRQILPLPEGRVFTLKVYKRAFLPFQSH